MAMSFFFNIKNDPSWHPGIMWFYNGDINEIQGVHNTEELKYIDTLWADTKQTAIKTYMWDAKVAPVYVRLFGVLQPGSQSKKLQENLRQIKALLAEYIKVYGDPTHFKAQMQVPIRRTPEKKGEILGIANIGDEFNMDQTKTVCDYHWGKIKYNGEDAWIPIGDLIGNVYGIWS